MKHLTSALLAILFPLLIHAQTEGNSEEILKQGKKKLDIPSGKIIYNITGDATGTATLYFDRNGWRQILIRELTFERYGIESSEKTVELIEGDYCYHVNLDSKKGTKKTDSRWSNLASYKSNKEINAAILHGDGGTPTGDTVLLELNVKTWTFSKGSTKGLWDWNGLVLKEIKSLPGLNYEMTAKEFIKGDAISEEVFTLPEEIEWAIN